MESTDFLGKLVQIQVPLLKCHSGNVRATTALLTMQVGIQTAGAVFYSLAVSRMVTERRALKVKASASVSASDSVSSERIAQEISSAARYLLNSISTNANLRISASVSTSANATSITNDTGSV